MQCILGNTIFLSYTSLIHLEEDHPIVSPTLATHNKVHKAVKLFKKKNFIKIITIFALDLVSWAKKRLQQEGVTTLYRHEYQELLFSIIFLQ